MKKLLQKIVEAVVSKPEAIEITETVDGHIVILELRVAKDDVG